MSSPPDPILSSQEGVVSPGDLDLVMSDGLGLRYAFIGPLETMHLNAEGRGCQGVCAGCCYHGL